MPKNGYKHKRKKILITHKDFYKHPRWILCRKIINNSNDMACLKCGSGEDICVDHIVPKTTKPNLAFDLFNLQQLCGKCNKDKYLDVADYRTPEYKKNIIAYLECNNLNKDFIKHSLTIKKFLFVYPKNHVKPEGFNGARVKRKLKNPNKKKKNSRTYKISNRVNRRLLASGFRDKDYDIGKIIELQNRQQL